MVSRQTWTSSVPPTRSVDIASKRGDVTVNDRKADVKISLQHGDVSLTEIAGAVKINLEKGSIRASQITRRRGCDWPRGQCQHR